ncbi:OmpA family protein [Nafulsella turpanensis]|uniref:OmpA family protein n=1 Tax=Nafulsella turpanensis TaxID=1265690 RepID=UPI00034DE1EE|nr:OmpA family protein [Nafulsella turpanensis]
MNKLLLFVVLLFALETAAFSFTEATKSTASQAAGLLPPDSLVLICGSVLNAHDSTPVVARIRYKKMPYGDDVGIFVSKTNGTFEMPVLDRNSYMFETDAEGYYPLRQQVEVRDFNGDNRIEKNFILVPLRVGQIMDFDNILFQQSEAILLQESYDVIDRLVDILMHNPSMVIQLEGHTDFRGPARANKRLSRNRVKVIRDYLINKGIDRDRVETKAFGGSRPISREDSPEGRKLNRRVEIRILEE